jgi:hypothetical protein
MAAQRCPWASGAGSAGTGSAPLRFAQGDFAERRYLRAAEFWSTVSTQPRVDLPAEALQKIVPAKTLLLQITAMDESAHTVADSGMVRFRFLQNVHSR